MTIATTGSSELAGRPDIAALAEMAKKPSPSSTALIVPMTKIVGDLSSQLDEMKKLFAEFSSGVGALDSMRTHHFTVSAAERALQESRYEDLSHSIRSLASAIKKPDASAAVPSTKEKEKEEEERVLERTSYFEPVTDIFNFCDEVTLFEECYGTPLSTADPKWAAKSALYLMRMSEIRYGASYPKHLETSNLPDSIKTLLHNLQFFNWIFLKIKNPIVTIVLRFDKQSTKETQMASAINSRGSEPFCYSDSDDEEKIIPGKEKFNEPKFKEDVGDLFSKFSESHRPSSSASSWIDVRKVKEVGSTPSCCKIPSAPTFQKTSMTEAKGGMLSIGAVLRKMETKEPKDPVFIRLNTCMKSSGTEFDKVPIVRDRLIPGFAKTATSPCDLGASEKFTKEMKDAKDGSEDYKKFLEHRFSVCNQKVIAETCAHAKERKSQFDFPKEEEFIRQFNQNPILNKTVKSFGVGEKIADFFSGKSDVSSGTVAQFASRRLAQIDERLIQHLPEIIGAIFSIGKEKKAG